MIIAGGSRSGARYWTWHLQRTDDGQAFSIRDVVGLMGQDMAGWFAQMEAMSAGGRTANYFYHFSLNSREDEPLTPEQVKVAVATTLDNLGLGGQPYFLVEHDKDGRSPHFHCIVLRVDLETGKAISDSHNYDVHMRTADELEKRFDHERTERGRGPDGPNPRGYEVQRGRETKIDPKEVAAELKTLWQQADGGPAFAAALADRGYILAKGDRRDFVVVDAAGNEHSLARRVNAKAAEIRDRMAAVDRNALPSVCEARALAREQRETPPDELAAQEPSLASDDRQAEPAQPLPTEPQPPPPEFDRFAAAMKEAMRAGRGEPSPSGGWRWLGEKATPPRSRPEPSVFGRFVEQMKDAMRAGGGTPDNGDGMTFWQRAAAVLSALGDRAASWVERIYRNVSGQLFPRGRDERDDPGFER